MFTDRRGHAASGERCGGGANYRRSGHADLGGTNVVVEVTGAVTSMEANQYTVPFANGDALNMNQTAAGVTT